MRGNWLDTSSPEKRQTVAAPPCSAALFPIKTFCDGVCGLTYGPRSLRCDSFISGFSSSFTKRNVYESSFFAQTYFWIGKITASFKLLQNGHLHSGLR